MGIQLISISHKTAPVSVRKYFAFDEEDSIKLMTEMKEMEGIDEVVLLSTCNRTEIYCSGENDSRNLKKMQELLVSRAELESSKVPDYIMRYSGDNAIHHLFMVTSGLDSALLGENQILGQVKNAFFVADKAGMCKSTFHALFQTAITAAKEVSTKTVLSKTPVSSASLSLKQMQKEYGNLAGKKLMIIGATGKLGEILLKDALDIEGLDIYITTRQEIFFVGNDDRKSCMDVKRGTDEKCNTDVKIDNIDKHDKDSKYNKREMPVISQKCKIHGRNRYYNVIPYRDRYLWANECDIIVSATRSPHYTIKKDRLSECIELKEGKRLFFDLAVPQDIDEGIRDLSGCIYYSLEDIEQIAKQNYALKKDSVMEAKDIIKKYEEDFLKDEYYRKSRDKIGCVIESILQPLKEAGREAGANEKNSHSKGDVNDKNNLDDENNSIKAEITIDKNLKKIFYRLKKNMTSEEFKHLLNILEKEADTNGNQTKKA